MSFKISTKNNVVTVDSSGVTLDDRLLVVFTNGDTLQFHPLPARYINDTSHARHYLSAIAPNKPQLWVDHSARTPHTLMMTNQGQHGWHGDLGFALRSELVINQHLNLDLMRIFRYDDETSFPVFQRVKLDPVVMAVFPITVPLGTRDLVKLPVHH